MRRRDLLRVTGTAGATALAGCTLGQSGLVDTRIDPHFEPRRQRRERPIVVSWDDDAGAVFVQGFMFYGSSSCNRIGVTEARYDAEADTLYTTLESVEKGSIIPNLGCTADMAASHYRVRFRFADALPETVVVREDGSGANDERTVVRSDQERLCTTDHPEGSDAAELAHWTCPERYLRAKVSVDSEE